jgi:hypothetical protein
MSFIFISKYHYGATYRTSLPAISKPLTEVIDDFVLFKRSIHTQIAYRNDIKNFSIN